MPSTVRRTRPEVISRPATSCTSCLQAATATALALPDTYFEELTRTYQAKRDRLHAGLEAAGFKVYADNPSQVAIIAAMTEDQKEMLRSEGRGATVELKHATIGSGGRIFESALRVSA